MPSPSFLALLPFGRPLDAQATLRLVQKDLANATQHIYDIYAIERSAKGLAHCRFKFTPQYVIDITRQIKTRTPDRFNDADVLQSMGIFNIEYSLSLSDAGIVRIEFALPTKWTVRALALARQELAFHLYDVAKYIVIRLREAGWIERGIEYKPWATNLSDHPEVETLRFFETLTVTGTKDLVLLARAEVELLAKRLSRWWKRMLLPIYVAFGGRVIKQAGFLHEVQYFAPGPHKLRLFLPALEDLDGYFYERLTLQMETSRRQLESFSSLGDFCFARFDSMTQILSIWAALLLGVIGTRQQGWMETVAISLSLTVLYVFMNARHPSNLNKILRRFKDSPVANWTPPQ